MLCQSCQDMFQGQFHGDYNISEQRAKADMMAAAFRGYFPAKHNYRSHQQDFSGLYQSTLDNCWICTQIFEDVCKYCTENDLCPEDSTPAEIEMVILRDAIDFDRGEPFTKPFTIYVFEDNERDNEGDITLSMYVETHGRFQPNVHHSFNLVTKNKPLFGDSARVPGYSMSRVIDLDWPLDLAQHWLRTCIDHHSGCSANISGWLPTRLLDVKRSEDGFVHLVETKNTGGDQNYMTLSHCWGKPKDIYKLVLTANKPKASTYQDLLAGIHRSILPKTFQNAIQVARLLGTRYLWIDSLCIIQDSTEDWQRESALMGEVYANAVLNIAATGSADGAGGLFRERLSEMPLGVTACYIRSSWTDHTNNNLLIHRTSCPPNVLLDGPLLSRGWVMQERIMARRMLHFGKNMLYWECNEHHCCEIYPTGIPKRWTLSKHKSFFSQETSNLFLNHDSNLGSALTTNPTTSILRTAPGTPEPPTLSVDQQQELIFQLENADESRRYDILESFESLQQAQEPWNGTASQKRALDCWNSIVSDYSQCALTFEKDKLVALSGVARLMKAHLGCDYLAGIWRLELERNLLWSTIGQCRRPKEYRAPSWSWTSVDGVIRTLERPAGLFYEKVEIEILSANTQKKSVDEMGQVVGGALTIRGPLMTFFVQKTEDIESLPDDFFDDSDLYDSDDLPVYLVRLNGEWSQWPVEPDAYEPFDTPLERELHILPIQKCYGLEHFYGCLLLESAMNQGEFRRYGTLEVDFMFHRVTPNGWKDMDHRKDMDSREDTNSGAGMDIREDIDRREDLDSEEDMDTRADVINEEWFGGGEADSEGRYTITII